MGSSEPELAAHLYTYLIAQPQYQTHESRKRLIKRLREALFKLVGLCGNTFVHNRVYLLTCLRYM